MSTKQKYRIHANRELFGKFGFLAERVKDMRGIVQNDTDITLAMVDAWRDQAESYKRQFDNLTKQTLGYLGREVEHATRDRDETPNITVEIDEPPSLKP